MKITKMSGAGNNFLIINLISPIYLKGNLSKLAINLCNKNHTDGVVFLKKSNIADFAWDFYNLDGSLADMCGNAARCVVQYSFKNKITGENVTFDSGNRTIKGEVIDSSTVKVYMGKVKILQKLKVLDVFGYLVNSGVLHFVVEVDDIDDPGLFELAKNIQANHSLTQNSNITFYSGFRTKSFERGVFKFTKACGTGVVAVGAALVFNDKFKFNDSIKLNAPGGELSVCIFDKYSDSYLIGDVRTLDNFEISKLDAYE